MPAASLAWTHSLVRGELTREGVRELMGELARTAPRGESHRVHFVGGGTAVLSGWRDATLDADLYAENEAVFRDVQGIKERLRLNIEYARPEQFVPPLEGSDDRHVFIDRIGGVEFYHYDPYAQLLSKIVRGFRKDLLDAANFVGSGMVEVERFRELVEAVDESAYVKYPSLSREAVVASVRGFLAELR